MSDADVGNEHLAIYDCPECGSSVGVVFHNLAGAGSPVGGCGAGCDGEMTLSKITLDSERPTGSA